jgi:UDP-N-acetylmuramyl pentapeptide phosphotransferase/UDP-N-acetylglucosamine-1-phosphate transferase
MAFAYEACLAGIAIVVATAALASIVTALAIRYAHHRRLFDLPGQRRAHRVPTPRGGGIAIVVAMVAGGCACMAGEGTTWLVLLLPPVLGVAGVGWLYDHGGLSARKRFVVHVLAAAWMVAGAILLQDALPPHVARAGALMPLAAVAAALAVVWSINLHNFMDGLNGLLTLQAMFVLAVLAALALLRGVPGGMPMLVCGAACAGFLPFNFPRARIFMGDVGSGVLGFVVGAGALWQAMHPEIAPTSGLVLCSAFVTDATCTLVSRMLHGRRWYSAHREHLYQWLVRCGFSHARIVALYMGWNLLVALPVVGWMNRVPHPSMSTTLVPAIAVHAVALAAWWFGKRWCLRHVRERSAHAAA